MSTIDRILVIGILIIICISVIHIAAEGYRIFMRLRFRSHFHTEPPVHSFIHKQHTNSNHYTLFFPRWRYALPDGSRKRRRPFNRLIPGKCTLYADNFSIHLANPIVMIKLVNTLRQHGFEIEQSVLEQEKEESVLIQKQLEQSAGSIDSVIETFAENPNGFKEYCTELYLAMGVTAAESPFGNKSEIFLTYENGETAIVRCRCCQTNQAIGKPFIQKLLESNETAQADHMIFITTGTFTSAAVSLAEEHNIMLVDGSRLLGMIQLYLGNDHDENPVELTMEDWFLKPEDLRQYIPEDIWKFL